MKRTIEQIERETTITKMMLDIVKRWHPIAPMAVFEQIKHEYGHFDNETDQAIRDVMWRLLSNENLIFTPARELIPS